MKVAAVFLLFAASCSAQVFGSSNARRIQNLNVKSGLACTDGFVLTWVTANLQFECLVAGGSGSTNVSGTANQITVTGSAGGPYALSLPSVLTLPGTLNKLTFTAPATGSTFTLADGKTFTVNNTVTVAGVNGTTLTFQGTDTYVGRSTTDTLANKTFIAPVLGDATGTSLALTGGMSTGSSPPTLTAGTGGAEAFAEGTVPSACAAASVDCIYYDSTQHGPLLSRNNGSYLPIPQAPASTTSGNVATFNAANGGLLADAGFLATNVVRKDTTNSGAAAMTLDMSASTAASALKVPVKASVSTAVNGAIGYDSTTDMLHAAQGSADAYIAQATITPTDADCVKWVVAGSKYKLGSAGAACGSGGSGGTAGSPLFTQTATVTVTATSETTLLGSGAGSLTIPANWFTAVGNSLIIESYGRLTTTTVPGTQRVRLKFGSTVMLDTGAYSLVGSITNGVYKMRTIITARTVGASGTLIAESIFETTGTALIPNEAKMLNTATITVDTTATQVVDFTNLFDTASNSISDEVFIMYGPGSAVSSVNGLTGAVTLFATNAQTSTYQVLAADFSACKTIPVASGTFTITLVASGSQPASGQCIEIVNYGSGVVTVARSGQNINGGTTSLTIPASSATAPRSAHIWSDGTNYFASTLGADAASVQGVSISGTPTSGQVPTATSGTAATWQTPAGGGGTFQMGAHVTVAAQIGAGATIYTPLQGGMYLYATEALTIAKTYMIAARTVTAFCASIFSTQPATGSLVVTLRDSASPTGASSDTALAVTFAASASETTQCATGSVSVSAGHYLDAKWVNNASTGSGYPMSVDLTVQ